MSIHASAQNNEMHFDPRNAPPLPGSELYRIGTNNLEQMLMRSHTLHEDEREVDLVQLVKTQFRNKDATEIDEFHKSLVIQKNTLDRDINQNIAENQKNIMQLTGNLHETQEELLLLRVLTKELYLILAEFLDAAERRLELENSKMALTTQNSHSNPSVPDVSRQKKRDRSSVIMLQKMWATELQLLYKHVDGAQKFVQAIPGRHLLGESGRWHEINIGTWKPTRPIHIFLLNDAVLVATRRLTQDGSSKRLQAVFCWPLSSVELTQIRTPNQSDESKVYAINVRANSLSYVYQTDRYDHFMRVMNGYAKGKAELAQKDREILESLIGEGSGGNGAHKEMGHHRNASSSSIGEEGSEKRQLRDSLRNLGIIASPLQSVEDVSNHRKSNSQRQSAEIMLKDISARVHSRNRSYDLKLERTGSRTAKEGLGRLFHDLKAAEDKLDEVDVNLAHNEYTNAVGLIKYIEQKVASVIERVGALGLELAALNEVRLLVDVVKLKILTRKSKVQQGLLFALHHDISTMTNSEIASIIEFYLNFDKLDEGIDALLDALLGHLASIAGTLFSNAHGLTRVDVVNYIANLTIVYVSIIRRAVTIHRQCVEPIVKRSDSGLVDLSGFITWCVGEMTQLVQLVKKSASGSLVVESNGTWLAKDVKYYEDMVRVIEPQLHLLKEEGLNVDYLFGDLLRCRPLAEAR